MSYLSNETWDSDIFSLLNSPFDFNQNVKAQRTYRLDKRDEWFYFFPKCLEEVLDVSVYLFEQFEIHHVETSMVHVRRCLFIPKLSSEEIDELDQNMFDKGYKKNVSRYVSRSSIAFRYENGLIFTSKSSLIRLGKGIGDLR
jgi:hypothetical protein